MESLHYTLIDSPLGEVLATADKCGLRHLLFEGLKERDRLLNKGQFLQENPEHSVLQLARLQLQEYFAGDRQNFTLPLAAQGTAFQIKVWMLLGEIPYGTTWHYAQLAQALGQPTAARAVGMANGKNPIGILVPCHRVIGKNQNLTGYAGGLERKAWLLAHESKYRKTQT